MTLEEEIKQEKFESEHQKALLNVMVTSAWLNTLNNNILKPFGISPQQYNVLRILKGQFPKPVTLSLVQERMIDKMSNASRLVDKLVEKKMVGRNLCCSNRRQLDIIITQEGLSLLQHCEAPMKEIFQGQKITPSEAMELSRILEKLRE